MAANDLERDLWKPKDIARSWKALELFEDKDEKSLREHITKKFEYILKKNLQFSDEEMAWFKYGRNFIFLDKNSPQIMLELFDLFYTRDVMLTPAEEDKLEDSICLLLDIDYLDERIGRIEGAIRTFARSAWDIEDKIDEKVPRFFRKKFLLT